MTGIGKCGEKAIPLHVHPISVIVGNAFRHARLVRSHHALVLGVRKRFAHRRRAFHVGEKAGDGSLRPEQAIDRAIGKAVSSGRIVLMS